MTSWPACEGTSLLTSLVERLRQVARLFPAERVVLVEAWGLHLLVALGLRVLSPKRLLALCQKVRRPAPEGSASTLASSLPRLVWLVEVAGRYAPVRATCLTQGLVLARILASRGIRPRLQIGVARHAGCLTAHAWLELDQEVTLGLPEPHGYAPLLSER